MYDEIAYLGPNDPLPMALGSLGGGAPSGFSTLGCIGTLGLPSFPREADTAIADLSLSGQLGFDPKHDLSNFQHCFNPDLPMLPMPSISFNHPNKRPVNFQAPEEVLDELSMGRGPGGGGLYDYPLREVLHSMPHEVGSLPGILRPCTGMVDEGYMEECALNPAFGFWREMGGRCDGRGKAKMGNTTEKHRRGKMSEKFNVLRELIPSPTKPDKASILADAADYIKELLREVEELQTLVRRKRLGGARMMKKRKVKDEPDVDMDSPVGLLRSSWLQRRSKETLVDVRIVEDEVNIKLTQRKKPGCLLLVSKVLEGLQLDILHLTFGIIGDCLIFMINTKIHEGAIVYASGIAKKLLEAMDLQGAAYNVDNVDYYY